MKHKTAAAISMETTGPEKFAGKEDLDPRKWVERHADYLYAFALSRLDDADGARDLVQDTFLSALQQKDRFEGRSAERTWLTAILRNKIIDTYRRKASGIRVERNVAVDTTEDFFDKDTGHWTALHAPQAFGIETYDPLAQKELGNVLRLCMEKLPALWYAVFTMKHIDEHDTETICTVNKVTPSNFWVIMHRAKVNLRACIQKNWQL